MIIKTFVEGPIDANNYLLIDENTKDAVLIDCSSPRDGFVEEIKKLGVNLKYVLLTHGHFDHIMGCDRFHKEFNVPVYVGEKDKIQIHYGIEMAAKFAGIDIPEITSINNIVNDGDVFKAGSIELKAISTPGHTEGGMCYLSNDDRLFSGDTLFRGSVGRCDLPKGNWSDIQNSVKNILFKLPDETEVFTGHGGKTTRGYEKKYNEVV